MAKKSEDPARIVLPRRSVLTGTAALVGGLSTLPTWVRAEGEGGEGGEGAALEGLEGAVEFLVELGLFEATIRIVSSLYASGHTKAAQEHLEYSHHASYEDLEHELEEYGAQDFEDEVESFADAVQSGASPDAVTAAAEAVLAGIAAAHSTAEAHDEIEAAEALVRMAYDDYEAGVADGVVDAEQEYRDAWGFVEAAKANLTTLAASSDAKVAGAAKAALAAIDSTTSLFPGLDATRVEGADASLLAGAAARIEIAGMRLK